MPEQPNKEIKLCTLKYSRVNQAIQIFQYIHVVLSYLVLDQITQLFCLHHLGRQSTSEYSSTDVPAHLISILPFGVKGVKRTAKSSLPQVRQVGCDLSGSGPPLKITKI